MLNQFNLKGTQKIKEHPLFEKVRYFQTELFFTLGFLFDIFTLGRIDDRFNIYGQSFYLTILYSIFTIQLLEIDFKRALFKKIALYLDDLLHFLTGSLLSAYSIFYFKSSSLSNSFIFMAIILAFLFLNETEFFKTRGLSVKSILISLCTISFLTYFIPMTIGRLGGDLFLLSTTLSLVSLFPLAYLLHKRRQGDLLKVISSSWCGVIIIFNLLYLAKMIPPVPLSLTKIGVFYKIEKENSDYLLFQKKEFFDALKFGESDFQYRENDRVYLYTSIFAPSEFQDTVFAVWQKEDHKGIWQTSDRIPLTLIGGRVKGFRATTYKSNYTQGNWRVLVETRSGREIGRKYFMISKADEQIELKEIKE